MFGSLLVKAYLADKLLNRRQADPDKRVGEFFIRVAFIWFKLPGLKGDATLSFDSMLPTEEHVALSLPASLLQRHGEGPKKAHDEAFRLYISRI